MKKAIVLISFIALFLFIAYRLEFHNTYESQLKTTRQESLTDKSFNHDVTTNNKNKKDNVLDPFAERLKEQKLGVSPNQTSTTKSISKDPFKDFLESEKAKKQLTNVSPFDGSVLTK